VIKAIFFDWFNTLAAYDPPREQLYCDAFKEQGRDISFIQACRGVIEGDRQFFSLVSRGLVKYKKLTDIEDVLTLYPVAICNAAGVTASPDVHLKVIRQVLSHHNGRMALFEDVLPVLQVLKKRGYVLGIITNADTRVDKLIEDLGLRPYLKAVITSEQAGAEKPDPAIFKAAYAQAGVKPEEMAYVGDSFQSDVLGANKAGSLGILLDRCGLTDEIIDCRKITALNQLLEIFK
jgi:HAD superfamily hydrolase (TIGR01549 family)